jgi:hypothetical protein
MKKWTAWFFCGVLTLSALTAAPAKAQAKGAAILAPADTAKLAPATVFFRGQSAPLQLRNTFGVRTGSGAVVLMGLVDSSGYSSGVQQKYQGYILTESPLDFSGKHLAPGAYAFGFVGANAFTVMDLGNHDLFNTAWASDAALHRPRPLQILPGAQSGTYRLYSGRKYVDFRIGR